MDFKSRLEAKGIIVDEKRTAEFKEFMKEYDIWCSYFVDRIVAFSVSQCDFSLQTAERIYAGLSEAGFKKIEEDKITGAETFAPKG